MNSSGENNTFSILRQRMVESQLRARGIGDERVLAAMLRVPRHEFAPERYRDQAYDDHPLPIGEGQTISQPLLVARMCELLTLGGGERVLDVSVERHAILADAARNLLTVMGYNNVTVIVGDGSRGLIERAPYDAVIVSAAAAEVPGALLEQLAEGGRLIIPIGTTDSQQLQLIRMENGEPRTSLRELCRFVPLVSGNAN